MPVFIPINIHIIKNIKSKYIPHNICFFHNPLKYTRKYIQMMACIRHLTIVYYRQTGICVHECITDHIKQ